MSRAVSRLPGGEGSKPIVGTNTASLVYQITSKSVHSSLNSPAHQEIRSSLLSSQKSLDTKDHFDQVTSVAAPEVSVKVELPRQVDDKSMVRADFTGARHDLWSQALDPVRGRQLAVTDGGTGHNLTYAELAVAAGRLALGICRYLGDKRSATSVVAVSQPRGEGMVVSMWATLLAGCVYTPMNPCLPSEAKHFLLTNTKAVVVLTSSGSDLATDPEVANESVPMSTCIVPLSTSHTPTLGQISLDGLPTDVASVHAQLEKALGYFNTSPADLAYYIHTSGSTGRPKCVTHVHSALDWHTHNTLIAGGICKRNDVILQVADCSFDLHIRDIFCGISFGAHVVTIPAESLVDMDQFTRLFETYRVTWLECVPLIMSVCVEFLESSGKWSRLSTLRAWSCIGAPFQLFPAQKLARHLPHVQFMNSYAPTENSLVTTCHFITPDELKEPNRLYSVPIGVPVPGWSCFLLNEDEPNLPLIVPQAHNAQKSASGVLHVRGPGVFQGYLNRPDLTELAMLRSHAILPCPLFRTGDVCHYDTQGRLVFEGRRDLQIKLRGQRLEPGEIEAVAMSHPSIKMAVVKLIKPDPEQPDRDFLCGYLTIDDVTVPENDSLQLVPEQLELALLAVVRSTLPVFMRPSCWFVMQKMPKTMSGKINRLGIPPPGQTLLLRRLERESQLLPRDVRGATEEGNSQVDSQADTENQHVFQTVMDMACEILQWDQAASGPIPSNTSLLSLGFTSLMLTRLVSSIRKELLPTVSLGALLKLKNLSISSLSGMISAELAAQLNDGQASYLKHNQKVKADYVVTPQAPELVGPVGRAVFTSCQILAFVVRLAFFACVPSTIFHVLIDQLTAVWKEPVPLPWTDETQTLLALIFAAMLFVVPLLVLIFSSCLSLLLSLHLRHLTAHGCTRSFSARSCVHLEIWIATRLASMAQSCFYFMQGTEFYNCVLRMLGGRVAYGSVVLANIDLPFMVDIDSDVVISKTAFIRSSRVSRSLASDGAQVVLLGKVRIGHHSFIAEHACILPGCNLRPYSCVGGSQTVQFGDEPCILPNNLQTNWSHKSGVSVVVQSLLLFFSAEGLSMGMVFGFMKLWFSVVMPQVETSLASGGIPELGVKAVAIRVILTIVAISIFSPGAVIITAAILVSSLRLLGKPPSYCVWKSDVPPSQEADKLGLQVGSWRFFRHVVLRNHILSVYGFPLFALQSSYLPTQILRLAGAKIGVNSVVFLQTYDKELCSCPIPFITVGDSTLITTHSVLGTARVTCGRWHTWHCTIGSGCLIGNHVVLDTQSKPIPDRTWVGAVSHVNSSSVSSISSFGPSASGSVLLGNPAMPLAVQPATLLEDSAKSMPYGISATVLTFLWLMLVPWACPTPMTVVAAFCVCFRLSWAMTDSIAFFIAGFVLVHVFSTFICMFVNGFLAGPTVRDGRQFDIFTFSWFRFHWSDMLLQHYSDSSASFFTDSSVWSFFLRLNGARVGKRVLISEPTLCETRLQVIGDDAVLGWFSWLQPHDYQGHTLNLKTTKVGKQVRLDHRVCVLPGATIEQGVWVKHTSLVMKGETLEADTCWQGVPTVPVANTDENV